MNQFMQLTKKRYSVRSFLPKKVEQDQINLILEAGKHAPTAVNYQPQRILVLNSSDSLNKLKECTPYHFQAPLAMVVCYDNTISWKRSYDEKEMGEVDASIVATHLMLQIADMGLGSTWVGHFDPVKIKKAFSLPEHIIPVAILPIGYPDESKPPHNLHFTRKELDATTIYDSF